MINLKNLKSLFIVDETTQKKEETEKQNPQQEGVQLTPPPLPENYSGNPETKTDPRVYEMLLSVIESNNQDGFDYLEFKASLQALNNLPLDEATKYKSAFATASTMGLTLDKLITSADFYKNVLNRERDKFKAELERKMQDTVVSKDKEKQQLEDNINKKEQQIANLSSEINQHRQNLAQLQQQLAEIQFKIQQTQSAFFNTHQHLLSQFEDDMQKMRQYLG
ncbi:MAG TPA: hypothetical protein PK239_08600 [Chitinophagales bacterium]|nr:hypothetical protein [Chitinophagales bacterium]HRK27335.1 hypothetical protein [Chitinophagales bacterium]